MVGIPGMFFLRKRSVLVVSRNWLRLYAAKRSGSHAPSLVSESEWNSGSLSGLLHSFFSMFPRRLRVVLAEELCYTVLAPLSKKKACDRQCVEHVIGGAIPENLADTVWDYRFVQSKKEGGIPETFIQATIVRKDFFEPFVLALRNAGFMLESVESESSVLTRMTENIKEPIVIVRGGNIGGALFVAAVRGLPIATEIIESGAAESIPKFLDFVRKRLGAPVSVLGISSTIGGPIREYLDKSDIPREEVEFDMCSGAMSKKRLRGQDETVLNLARE